MTLDELLTSFKDEYGDTWYLAALDRSLYLHASAYHKDDEEHLLLKKWVEDMVAVGIGKPPSTNDALQKRAEKAEVALAASIEILRDIGAEIAYTTVESIDLSSMSERIHRAIAAGVRAEEQ